MKMTTVVSLLCAVLLMLSRGCRANENSTANGTAKESGYKHTLYFLSMLPYPDPRPSFQPALQDGPDIVPAAYLAIDEINSRTDILSDYQIELIEADGGCDIETKPLEAFVADVIHGGKQVVGIVGPGCSDSAVAVSALCSLSEIALVTVHIANTPLLANRKLFPYAFATADISFIVAESIIGLMRYNDWRRVSLIYDVSTLAFTPVVKSLMEETNRLPGYSVTSSVPFRKVNDIPVTDIENSFVRIIIVMAFSNEVCELLCLAHQRQLVYPAYQWVIYGTYPPCRRLLDVNATVDHTQYSCTAEELMTTLPGVSMIAVTFPADNNALPKSNITYEEFRVEVQAYGSNYSGYPNDIFYDGVWSLALALNYSVELLRQQNLSFSDYHYGMEDITQVIQEQFYRLDFNGVSGRVKYEPNSGSRNYTAILQQYTSSLAYYRASFQHGEWDNLDNATFISGEFPSEFSHLSYIYAAIVLVIASTTTIVVASLHILTLVYRDDKSVKASSPTLNHLVYIGCYAILFAVVIFTLIKVFEFKYGIFNVLCNATVWFVSLGLTLMLGPVCFKTWRLYDIFGISSRHLSTSAKFTNRVLVIGVLILELVDITICVIWFSVDPLVQHTTQSFETIHGDRFVVTKYTCQSKGHMEEFMVPLLVLYKLLLLACSAYLAFLTRRIRMELFKTRNVTRLAYLFCLVGALGLPALFITQHLGKDATAYAILCTLLVLLVILCLVFLFLPPLLPKLKAKVSSCLPVVS